MRHRNIELTDKAIQQKKVQEAKDNVIMVIMEPIKRKLEEQFLY